MRSKEPIGRVHEVAEVEGSGVRTQTIQCRDQAATVVVTDLRGRSVRIEVGSFTGLSRILREEAK